MRTLLFFLILISCSTGFAQSYKVGEKVEVQVEEVWFDAYVIELTEKKVRLNYSRVSDDTDFWVKTDEIRKKKNAAGVNSGNGKGSISYDHSGGTPTKETKSDGKKKKKGKVSEDKVLKKVTLSNTCSRKETFVIDGNDYDLDANTEIIMELNTGTLIYSKLNGEKVLRGKVTNAIVKFRPSCN